MGILKKRVILPVIIFTIIILVTFCALFLKESKVEPVDSVKLKVVTYLTEKGYKEEEYKLKAEYHIMRDSFGSQYSINVTFNDEPNVIYNYNYGSKLKEITQMGISPMKNTNNKNFRHAEN